MQRFYFPPKSLTYITDWDEKIERLAPLALKEDIRFLSGAPGWLAFPFMLAFELLAPLIEVAGYLFIGLGFAFGVIGASAFWTFMLLAIALGMMLSASALLMEEISFHIYKRPRELFTLAVVAIIENFGYRQLNSLWRLHGLWLWARGKPVRWGEMKRTATWQRGG